MSLPPFAAVILAAGKGTRMKSSRPKVLHEVAGRSLLRHCLQTIETLGPDRVVVVVGPDMDPVRDAAAPHAVAIQAEARGTGNAVKAARQALAGFDGDVFVLFADNPFIAPETVERMRHQRVQAAGTAVVVLGFRPSDPARYGRLKTGSDGRLEAIVEYRDATEAERAIGLCNSGVMGIEGRHLFRLLDRVTDNNAKGEYYLTDIVALARADGLGCTVVEADPAELLGVNSRSDLAAAESVLQARLRQQALAQGVTLIDPDTVYLRADTQLGRDVTIGPFVVFGNGVTVADGAEIRAFSHIDGASIGPGAIVGPYARLRPGARLEARAHVGNFVEIKNAHLEAGAKANHLTYIGDAQIGAGTNIGAGTITCNYDGYRKSRTEIGAGAFIGSNSALVAPVTVGSGAIVAAGSTVTEDVPADALMVARARPVEKAGWAAQFHDLNRKKKA